MNWYAIYIYIKTVNGHYIRPYAFDVQLPNNKSETIDFAICEELKDKFSEIEDPLDPYDYRFVYALKIDHLINS